MRQLTPCLDRVLDKIEQREVVEVCRDLIKIPTYREVGETGAALYLRDYLMRNGVEAEVREVMNGRSNVVARVRGRRAGPSIMLNGHLDTVVPGSMNTPPFDAVMRDGIIYGRGAADMKGGVAAMAVALVAIRRSCATLDGDVLFSGVVGEEAPDSSEGTKEVLEKGPRPQMVINGEPTGLDVVTAHKGMAWFTIVCRGKSAHGSVPSAGKNAALHASRIVVALDDELGPLLAAPSRSHALLGSPTLCIGALNAGIQSNIVPDSAVIRLDRRWLPGEVPADLQAEIQDVVSRVQGRYPEIDATVEADPGTADRCPLEISTGHPLCRSITEAVELVLGTGGTRGVDFWTDAALFSAEGIPAVVFGPGDIRYAHSADDQVKVSDLILASKTYAAACVIALTQDR